MDAEVLRAWWFERQGLGGGFAGLQPAEVLQRSGWARSVGGVNPYLTLFARAGISREAADTAVAELDIYELPSARGCTYVVPKSQFALALKVGQPTGDPSDIQQAKKYLGVTEEELQRLADRVLEALGDEPKDPAALKDQVGDAVRSLGPEGKKRGMTTTLPMVLGRLQSTGQIRRKAVNGRLDQQRYGYVRWDVQASALSHEEAHTELARLYFRWIGPASPAHFRWFSGLGVKATKDAIEPLGLRGLAGTDMLMYEEDLDDLLSFVAPKEPRYSLVASIDAIFLHRREIAPLLDPADANHRTYETKGSSLLAGVQDLSNHAILDRGRIIGLWEYDSFAGEIVCHVWTDMTSDLRAEIEKTETFVREQLGDARSFSLDSPESRRSTVEALRAAAAVPVLATKR